MKKTLYIHIGSHKTATTYIQEIFATNRTILEQADLLFPKSGEIYRGHHRLASVLLEYKYKEIIKTPKWANLIQEIEESNT